MAWFEFYGDDYFDSLFMKDLGRDEAYLRIFNDGQYMPVYLLQSHKECVEVSISIPLQINFRNRTWMPILTIRIEFLLL